MVYSENRFLSLEEMTVNAQYILDDLTSKGWTKESVCGMLGNQQTESTINPGIWQNLDQGNMNVGFGLVQWTPASKYTNWADSNGFSWGDINGQLQRFQYEIDNNIQWIATSTYNFSFAEFKVSTQSPEYLADAFLKCYERPADQNQPDRGIQARYWYDVLQGNGGGPCIQLAQFPMDTLNVTQGEDGGFSHQGSLAMDFVGTSAQYPYNAPCDCECIARNDSATILTFKSNGQVMCADGQLREIVWRCIHDNNMLYNVGDKLVKGQLMGHTGTGGNASGDHLHLDSWLGTSYTTENPLHLYEVFAVNNVNIVNGDGYNWRTSDYVDCSGGHTPSKESDDLIRFLLADVVFGWNYSMN